MYSSTTLEGPSESGCWKPIESCPVGTVVLMWRKADLSFSYVFGEIDDEGDHEYRDESTCLYYRLDTVSHWMELPEGPK